MKDQASGRPLPESLLKFIGPPAVIGHTPALEKSCIIETRIVDHRDDDLSLDIDTLEIVPPEFRGRYTEAAEDKLGRGKLHPLLCPGRPGHKIFGEEQFGLLLSLDFESSALGFADGGNSLDLLEPASAGREIIAARSGTNKENRFIGFVILNIIKV